MLMDLDRQRHPSRRSSRVPPYASRASVSQTGTKLNPTSTEVNEEGRDDCLLQRLEVGSLFRKGCLDS